MILGGIVLAPFVEDEEEGIENYLLIIRKSCRARWSFLERSKKHLPLGARPPPIGEGFPC